MVTTADKAPLVSPVIPVTVSCVLVAAVTVPVPAGENTTVLLPGVVASKPVPLMTSVAAPVVINALEAVTVGGVT